MEASSGKRCVNKRGKVGDSLAVEHWRGAVGKRLEGTREEILIAWLLLGSH